MPTLYTALRAAHRTEVVPPAPPLPKSEVFAAPETSLLAAEQSLTERMEVTPETVAQRKAPRKKIVIIGAGLAGLCAAYELAAAASGDRKAHSSLTRRRHAADRHGGRTEQT